MQIDDCNVEFAGMKIEKISYRKWFLMFLKDLKETES